jgi:hypothetical protein
LHDTTRGLVLSKELHGILAAASARPSSVHRRRYLCEREIGGTRVNGG